MALVKEQYPADPLALTPRVSHRPVAWWGSKFELVTPCSTTDREDEDEVRRSR